MSHDPPQGLSKEMPNSILIVFHGLFSDRGGYGVVGNPLFSQIGLCLRDVLTS